MTLEKLHLELHKKKVLFILNVHSYIAKKRISK